MYNIFGERNKDYVNVLTEIQNWPISARRLNLLAWMTFFSAVTNCSLWLNSRRNIVIVNNKFKRIIDKVIGGLCIFWDKKNFILDSFIDKTCLNQLFKLPYDNIIIQSNKTPYDEKNIEKPIINQQ